MREKKKNPQRINDADDWNCLKNFDSEIFQCEDNYKVLLGREEEVSFRFEARVELRVI